MNNTPKEKRKKKTRTFIIKDRQGFTQISNQMLSDQKISYKAKGILCHLVSHDTDRFVISTQTLIKHGADGEKAIRTGIKELKLNGYLQIIQEAGNKGKWNYYINQFGNKFTDPPKTAYAETVNTVLGDTNKNTNYKNNNQCVNPISPEMCEEKKGSIVNNNEGQENKAEPEPAHTQTIEPIEKIEQSPEIEHTHYEDPIIEELSKDSDFDKLIQSLNALNTNIGEETRLATTTKQTEIEQHYSNEIAKVEQEYNLQRDINIPKLSIDSLLTASEDFLGRVGIGFDNNPRRILNLIYKQLPKDFVIKEDSKDVEILGDMIRKYTSSGKDERESIAKRIYQSVEAMLKIYVIKKYGEPYREIIFPDIAKANLALYLNCNPTFKYCLGGFSNDIDGVYTEICRLAEKDAKKKVNAIKIEHEKKVRQLEANRQTELQSVFSPEQRANFQKQNDEILRRMDAKGDIEDMPLAKPIQANLTDDERAELNLLFVKADKSQEDVIRLKFLVKKSKK
jgi:hypothetical protein